MDYKYGEEKLAPLRRFARDNLYSAAYLSLLVQRGKLKARRIGRNYFTTETWFREYLRMHAQDDIRLKYLEELEPEPAAGVPVEKQLARPAAGRTWFNTSYGAIAVAVVFLLFVLTMAWTAPRVFDKGIVAGEQESGEIKGLKSLK